MPEAALAYFDTDGAESLLYELRFLAVDKRVEPAMYIVANNLDVKACLGVWMNPSLPESRLQPYNLTLISIGKYVCVYHCQQSQHERASGH